MKWETPEYSDIRFGFEVTMYINTCTSTTSNCWLKLK
jgi:coenzyme PQQ precursor peptide PqqA